MEIYIIDKNKIKDFLINEAEKFCHKDFSNSKKRSEHCLTYYFLDKILRDFYSIDNRKIVFKNKKPYLETEKMYFSISHSKDLIAICISDYDCGIDIEIKSNRDFKKISKRMNFKAQNINDFYKEWTDFEARYKLGTNPKSSFSTEFKNYTLTAVSSNQNESFERIKLLP